MGLDIAFSYEEAIKAGLIIKKQKRGTEEEIYYALHPESRHLDLGYVDWLKSEMSYINVPYADHNVEVDIYDNKVSVRANKWGKTYRPLTKWLMENNISWYEY